jgi:hypothetical protein
MDLPPFLCFWLPSSGGVVQGEADFKVVVVNHQADRSLSCLTSHPVEKVPQRGHLLVNQMLARVAVDNDRVIKQKLPALGVVPPNTLTPWKGRRPTEQCAKHV